MDRDTTNTRPYNKPTTFNIIKQIESKVNDGEIKGAAQLLFSDDCDDHDTLAVLASKHPPSAIGTQLPEPPKPSDRTPKKTAKETLAAIMSFRNGSAGGLDHLTPQHLKDLLCKAVGETGRTLLHDITRLANFMLSGKVCEEITDILFGANLIALKKKDGGIRLIAVGNTVHRMVSKICCSHILPDLSKKFQPIQLGFGCRGGCKAAVHAARTF